MQYYELKFSNGINPEENTAIIEAEDMSSAIQRYNSLIHNGKIVPKRGELRSCRLIFYVYDTKFNG